MLGPYLSPPLQRTVKHIWHTKLKSQRYTTPCSVSGFHRTGKAESGVEKDEASGASRRPHVHSVDPPWPKDPFGQTPLLGLPGLGYGSAIRTRGERDGWETVPPASVCKGPGLQEAGPGHGPSTQHRRQRAGPLFSCTAWGANRHGFRVRGWAPDQDGALYMPNWWRFSQRPLLGQLQAHARWTGSGGDLLCAGHSRLAPSGPSGLPAKGRRPAPSAAPALPTSGWESPVCLPAA